MECQVSMTNYLTWYLWFCQRLTSNFHRIKQPTNSPGTSSKMAKKGASTYEHVFFRYPATFHSLSSLRIPLRRRWCTFHPPRHRRDSFPQWTDANILSQCSEVSHHCRPAHLHGHDRLLSHNDPPPSSPPPLHAQVRPRREEEGPFPRSDQGGQGEINARKACFQPISRPDSDSPLSYIEFVVIHTCALFRYSASSDSMVKRACVNTSAHRYSILSHEPLIL